MSTRTWISATTFSCGFWIGENRARVTQQPGPRTWRRAQRNDGESGRTPGIPEVDAPYLQAAQGTQAQEIARFLGEALAEAGGRPLHGARDLRGEASQRQDPALPQQPQPRFNPHFPTLLTALNPRGGGAEADDQARPANGAASGPGSILLAKCRRRWTASDF